MIAVSSAFLKSAPQRSFSLSPHALGVSDNKSLVSLVAEVVGSYVALVRSVGGEWSDGGVLLPEEDLPRVAGAAEGEAWGGSKECCRLSWVSS